MANLSIPSIRQRLFNTSKHEQSTQRNSSNPFAASTFKGNVLTADVFESSTKSDGSQTSFTGKLKASALVGSISGIGQKFQNVINSVVGFGNRIKENVVNGWNKINEIGKIEISFAPAKEYMMEGMTNAYNITKKALFTPIDAKAGYNSAKEIMNTHINELITSGIKPVKYYQNMENMEEAKYVLSNAVKAYEEAASVSMVA